MNLTYFLKQTDAILERYSKEQLISFIREVGRVIPDYRREEFLGRLKAVGGITEGTEAEEAVEGRSFGETYRQLQEQLGRIEAQEVTVTGILNEEYDDWYDDCGEEFYYKDDCGVSDILAEACAFVHASMDTESYQEGFEIGNQLFSMAILCVNEEYGDEDFSLRDMVFHGLLQCDLKQVALDTLYCAYHAVPLNRRPEVLYDIIVNAGRDGIMLEEVMQHGGEALPDFTEFLPCWITYLGDQTGFAADRLIPEAISLLNDASSAVGYAKRFAMGHPGIYLNILENEPYEDVNAMVSIGMEAMKRIPKKYVMRSRAALKTAEYVLEANGEKALLEQCYFVAYESNTSALNYIRVLLNGYGGEKKREELQNVFMAFASVESRSSYDWPGSGSSLSEREENRPDGNMILLLRFLAGQFSEVLEEGLGREDALGWSGTFMKQGIALFLLCCHEGRWTGRGMSAMADTVKTAMGFTAEEYQKGLCRLSSADENELFYSLISQWKSEVQPGPEVRDSAINKITGLLERRVEAIMNKNRRNYYGECAAYIAALGEVQESLGSQGAKQRLMSSYKDKYSRRTAFRAELKAYGWKEIKG